MVLTKQSSSKSWGGFARPRAAILLASTFALAAAWLAMVCLHPELHWAWLFVPVGVGAIIFGVGALVEKRMSFPDEDGLAAEARFLGKVSHEIRTPLNGILGLTQLLLKTDPTERQHEHLEMIQSSGESLKRLIDDLLDYSKIQSGKLGFALEEFRLRTLLRQTVKSLASQAHLKKLELLYCVEPEVPEVLTGDPDRLRQVLANLLVNAIKFTEEGEVSVLVSRDPDRASDASIRFTVRDTGMGIPEASRRTIFEAFSQGTLTGGSEAGVGLGLAISSQLVERMGGSIDVESEEGSGSCFSFTIDFPGSRREEEPIPETLRGSRALLIDDNATHRHVLKSQMEAWGVDSEATGDPREALATIERSLEDERPFSLVMIDSRMPGVDSWSLNQEIQSRSPIPAILMTLSHEHVDNSKLRAHGFLGHLGKPIAPSHLLRAIEIIHRGATVDRAEDVQTHSMDRLVLGGLSVLLAEDDPVNRTVVEQMLGKSGTDVVAVDNGRAALELAQKMRFDILLLDVQMPEMDGLSVARAIREREAESGRRLPIVALTAHAHREDRERCLRAGMDVFLSKPFREEELVSVIERALAGSGSEREPGSGGEASPALEPRSALERAHRDPALLTEMIELFLRDLPGALKEIRIAVARGERERVARLAHRLHGSLLTLSAHRAAGIALELEKMTGSPSEGEEIVHRLEAELEALEPELIALASGARTR